MELVWALLFHPGCHDLLHNAEKRLSLFRTEGNPVLPIAALSTGTLIIGNGSDSMTDLVGDDL